MMTVVMTPVSCPIPVTGGTFEITSSEHANIHADCACAPGPPSLGPYHGGVQERQTSDKKQDMYTYIYIYIYILDVHTGVCLHVCMCMLSYAYIHVYIYIYTHTHVHTLCKGPCAYKDKELSIRGGSLQSTLCPRDRGWGLSLRRKLVAEGCLDSSMWET